MSNTSTSNQDPAELEREADVRRANLNKTLNAVEERFSPNHLAKQAVDYFGDHGSDIAQSVGQSVKQNPLPLLLTGIGLAWLISTQSRGSSSYNGGAAYPDRSNRWDEDNYRTGRTPRAYAQNALSVADGEYAGGRDSFDYDTYDLDVDSDSDSDDGSMLDDAKEKADSLKRSATQWRDELTEKLKSVKQETGESVEQWQERVINTSVEQADSMDQQYRQAKQDMIARSRRAKQEMVERSRQAKQEMMVRGRQAKQQMVARGGDYVESTKNFMQDQPLVAGALGVAAGALIGSLLPSSKMEDEMVGDRADNLKSSLARQAESAGEEAASAVADKAQTLREKGERRLDEATS